MKNKLFILNLFTKSEGLITVLAQMCHYAQENVYDPNARPSKNPNELTPYMINPSYQVSCFLAQNTVKGENGVESDVVLGRLCQMPAKSVQEWERIIARLVQLYGGFWG